MPTAKKSETEDVIETEAKTGLELTEREKALASGQDPDEMGAAAEESDEESDDTEVDEPEAEDADDSSEDTEVSAPDWREGVKELAESYGMDDDALAAFDDEKDFRRFASIYEKTLGKQEKPKGEAKEEGKEAPAPAEAGDDLDPAVFENEGYDENTLKIVKTVARLQDAVRGLTSRNEELSKLLEQSNGQREYDALTQQVNEMGGRFGDGEKLTADEKKARERLLSAVDVVKRGFEAKGIKASTQTILRRAELLEFGDEIIAEAKAKEKEALSQSVKKQSAKRRAVGRNTKPPARRELPGAADDPVKAIANLPEIVEAWEAAQF